MFTITLDPIIAHIGPLVLRWHSLILITKVILPSKNLAVTNIRRARERLSKLPAYFINYSILFRRKHEQNQSFKNRLNSNPRKEK
jgi:prolipoprotein diacylglyceryltransferase